MNIKILDSWLKEYVRTKASPQKIAELLSLSSVSVEKLEKYKHDYVYDIEITTNRPDLMSVVGLARETAAVLKQNGIEATFHYKSNAGASLQLASKRSESGYKPDPAKDDIKFTIKTDPKLTNRILAVVMEVTVKPTSKIIQERLETTDIRSLSNLIDITNYVMRITGHPTHVFDYDRLNTKSLTIRESKAGEKIITLDNKTHTLKGGDIIAVDDKGRIIDLLAIMGLENSVVTNQTKRILFFLDNDNQHHIRKSSMSLGIRSEAAILNEKGVDPELAWDAFCLGIQLFKEYADGKVISPCIDIYPNKVKKVPVTVTGQQINTVIGVTIPLKQAAKIVQSLEFDAKITGDTLLVTPPSFRAKDITIPEDVIEEIARIYGYHNIPSKLPSFEQIQPTSYGKNAFFWENHVKDMLKYWGFTEVYTYPMVSKQLYEGAITDAVAIDNPLSEEFVYMRRTLTPSLLKVISENKKFDECSIFELANVYTKKVHGLPEQTITLAAAIKKAKVSFFAVKGIVEQLLTNVGITATAYSATEKGARISHGKTTIGEIAIQDDKVITFELNFVELLKQATLHKIYKPASIYPPIVEDLAVIAPPEVLTGTLIETIQKQSKLIMEVSLLDKYEDTRTFHVVYQSYEKNLTTEEVGEIRKKILKALKEKHNGKLKE